MKHISILVPFLLVWLKAEAQKPVTISGTITDPADTKVILVNAGNVRIIPGNRQETLTLSPEGKFSVTLPVTQKYSWIILAHGGRRFDFMAREGSELVLTANGKKLDSTVVFEGKGKEVPAFFARRSAAGMGLMSYYRQTQDVAACDTAGYMAALDSVKRKEQEAADIALARKELPGDFHKYWSAFLEYSAYDAMLHYPAVHEMIRLKSNNIQNIPPELYAITRQAPAAFRDEYLELPFYQTYVQSYFAKQLAAQGFNNTITVNPETGAEDRSLAYRQTDSVLQLLFRKAPPKTAEFAAGRILATESMGWPVEALEERVALYRKRFPQSPNNKILDSLVYEGKKFNPGQPAMDFTFTTIEGRQMKLSDLKGKVVYMDFWASWCGPCRGEMPHAKTIKEHFRDKDVVFLYVSIDENEAAWKRGIESMSISGIHTRTPGWGGDIATLYQIRSVPAYFLIDKKGNFVNKKTPRPSQSAELIRQIEALL